MGADAAETTRATMTLILVLYGAYFVLREFVEKSALPLLWNHSEWLRTLLPTGIHGKLCVPFVGVHMIITAIGIGCEDFGTELAGLLSHKRTVSAQCLANVLVSINFTYH